MQTPTHIAIYKGERQINRLRSAIHETVLKRDRNKRCHQIWLKACHDFHENYDALVFSYYNENDDKLYQGEQRFYQLFNQNNPYALEFAVCFVEIRPYYFRSGYVFQDLIRKLNNKLLTAEQRQRYEKVKMAYEEYRQNTKLRNKYA